MSSIDRAVESCRDGTHPSMVAKMASGWAVMGQSQFLTGYCLLLPDPVVADLNELKGKDRDEFLSDMARLGDAVLQVTNAVRINYAIFGNQDPALHAHVIPRFKDEPESLSTKTPWAYDWDAGPIFDEEHHGKLVEALRGYLQLDHEP